MTESIPRVRDSERLATMEVAPNFWRATARYGFMERPDVPALLRQAREQGCSLAFDDVTYYVGHETIIRREDGKGSARWEEALFAAMERNAVHVSDFSGFRATVSSKSAGRLRSDLLSARCRSNFQRENGWRRDLRGWTRILRVLDKVAGIVAEP